MSEVLILGAGASVEAGIPIARDMSRKILQILSQDSLESRYGHVVAFVLGGLLFQRGIRGEDPLEGADVEELFSAVQLLASRHTLEAAPFVGSWHAMVDEFDRRRRSPGFAMDRLTMQLYESITREIKESVPHGLPSFADSAVDKEIESLVDAKIKGRSSSGHPGRVIGEQVIRTLREWTDKFKRARPHGTFQFERDFSDAVKSVQSEKGEGEVFAETAEAMLGVLKDLVWIEDATRVRYLAPLAEWTRKLGRLTVVTLNYDNAAELMASDHSVDVWTGIEEWSTEGTLTPPEEGLRLIKIHGSIDWILERGVRSDERPIPHSVIRRASDEDMTNPIRPAVIFGQRSKLTAEGPFLDLLRLYSEELQRAQRITVIGYSFRDQHVNEFLARELNRNRHCRLRIIDPGFGLNAQPFVEMLRSAIGDRLEVISEPTSAALANLQFV